MVKLARLVKLMRLAAILYALAGDVARMLARRIGGALSWRFRRSL